MNDNNINRPIHSSAPPPADSAEHNVPPLRNVRQGAPYPGADQQPYGQPPQYGAPAGAYPPGNMPPKKHKKKKNKGLVIFRKIMTVIATTLLSLFLVMVITGTIVATALTVYVLDFMEDSTRITLQELESGSDTLFYTTTTDEEGNEKLKIIHRVKTDVQRIPVSIDKIPQHVRDAFVYTEDERFYTHEGVDYKRTFSAFVNMFLHIYDTEQGGSTITQQLIKNLTGDNEHSPQRKIREIFSAMQLEKSYTKDEILEEYLNYIGFGGAVNGIELASLQYFGKHVNELTTPEAAVLAAIPKSPEEFGPFTEYYDKYGEFTSGRLANRDRQKYVLYKLYDNGAITYDDYQKYLNTPIVYADTAEYDELHPEKKAEELVNENKANSWEVDAVYREFETYLMDKYHLNEIEARNRINKGGYKVYTTIDHQMQEYVTEKFLDINNIVSEGYVFRWADLDGDGKAEEYKPHLAFVALNYDGTVRAIVGQWGEKKDSLVTSFADHDKRPVGSTIKPISGYGYCIEHNLVHWGSPMTDKYAIVDPDTKKPWPDNYDGAPTGGTHPLYYFLQNSINTVSAQLVDMATLQEDYKFVTENMGLRLNPDHDISYSPLSIGQFRDGVTLENLVNAYIPYGNPNYGVYNQAHIITKIEDSNSQVIYQNDGNATQAVSPETAYVMNRLMKNVVEHGTGVDAQLSNKVVVGKTGTTENWWDLTFVGLTRDFVSGITIGYDINSEYLELPHALSSAMLWKNIIGEYANNNFLDTPRDFDVCETVIAEPMCSSSGMRAGSGCPHGITGYWKPDYAPICNGGHYVKPTEPEGGEGGENGEGGEGGGDNNGGGEAGGDNGGGDAGGGDAGGGDAGGGDAGGGEFGNW